MTAQDERLSELLDRLDRTLEEIRDLVAQSPANSPTQALRPAEERNIRAFADETLRARDA